MKRLKNKIVLVISLFLFFVAVNFSSDIVYLSELVGTVFKMQRTNADITDYKYFENIILSKSTSPQPWPIHKNYNTITADYLISYNNTDLVDMRNNVVIITSSNDTLFTDQLYYNKSQQWLFTNFPFRYKSFDKDISGVGFDSNIDFTQINFLDVNGYVYLDE